MSKVFKRSAFVVLLVVIGFAFERAWQTWSSHETPIDMASERTRIVLIGGSLATGVGPVLQTYLRRSEKRETIDVIEKSFPSLSIEEAKAAALSAIEKYRPRAIVFMVGLTAHKEEGAAWFAKAKQLQDARAFDVLATLFGDEIAAWNFTHVVRYLRLEKRRLKDERFDRFFVPVATNIIDSSIEKSSTDDRERSRALWTIAIALSTLPRDEADIEVPRVSDRAIADVLRERVRRLTSVLRRWPEEAKGKDYSSFVRSSDSFDGLLRRWFWITWVLRKDKSEQDAVRYYVDHPNDLVQVVPGFHRFRGRVGVAELLKDEPSVILLRALDNVNLDAQRAAFPRTIEVDAIERLRETSREIRSRGVKPIFLHYPGLYIERLETMAREEEVGIVGDGGVFDELIAANGRHLYFFDQMGDTGHLTDAGIEIYCRAIADRLARALGESR